MRAFEGEIDCANPVDRQIVCDALEFVLGDLLIEVFTKEDELNQYYEIMRQRAVGGWRRKNQTEQRDHAGADDARDAFRVAKTQSESDRIKAFANRISDLLDGVNEMVSISAIVMVLGVMFGRIVHDEVALQEEVKQAGDAIAHYARHEFDSDDGERE